MCNRAQLARLVVLPAVLLLLVAGCQPTGRLGPQGTDDWSRSVYLGQTVLNGQVGLASLSDCSGLAVAWVAEGEDGSQRLRLARVSGDGRIEHQADLDLPVTRPEQVTLLGGVHGDLSLFWMDRLGDDVALLCVVLDRSGAPVGPPQHLSGQGERATSYIAAGDRQGGAHVVWAEEDDVDGRLRAVHISPEGDVTRARALNLVGSDLGGVVDSDGTLHLAWAAEPDSGRREIRYATYDLASGQVSQDVVLANLPVPIGLVLRPPSIGVATDWVYIFWSLERRGGGPTPPSAESYVVAFPRGAPEEADRPRKVIIPAERDPDYVPVESPLPVRHLAMVPERALAAQFVYYAAPARAEGAELPVAFAVQLAGRTKSTNQIVLSVWREGRMLGYQVVTRTESVSLRPNLLYIESRGLVVAWIDTAGFRSYDVCLAGTLADMRAHLNRVRLQDVAAAVASAAWGLVQALGFLPVVVAWFLAPLALLSIYALIQPEEDLRRGWPQAALTVACLLYLGVKYVLRPGWLMEFPGPKGTSVALAESLALAAPVLIALVAAGVVTVYVRRHEYPSLFPAFLLFAGSDAVLTLLIYVPSILSE